MSHLAPTRRHHENTTSVSWTAAGRKYRRWIPPGLKFVRFFHGIGIIIVDIGQSVSQLSYTGPATYISALRGVGRLRMEVRAHDTIFWPETALAGSRHHVRRAINMLFNHTPCCYVFLSRNLPRSRRNPEHGIQLRVPVLVALSPTSRTSGTYAPQLEGIWACPFR